MKTFHSVILCFTSLCAFGCFDNINEITDLNQPPEARARSMATRLLGDGGMETVLSNQATHPAPAAGGTVTVVLDGTTSTDGDGTVEQYDWRNAATIAENCTADVPVPEPWDGAKPTVELPAGVHVFHLWVTDNEGAVSRSDRVVISVGEEDLPQDDVWDLIVQEDAGTCPVKLAVAPVNEATCLALPLVEGVREECQACTCAACPVEASKCDMPCWGLVSCVAIDCMGETADTTCIFDKCSAFLGAATPATDIGPCAVGCVDECMPL